MISKFSHEKEHIDENMVKLEVNLDDMPAEWLGYVMDLLFEAGANDVFYTSIYMKKNRPGVLLQVLCSQEKVNDFKEIIFRETTTLGIRIIPLYIHRLERKFVQLETPWGQVTVKVGLFNGQVVQQAPEYEDCREIALKERIPIKTVYQSIWALLKK